MRQIPNKLLLFFLIVFFCSCSSTWNHQFENITPKVQAYGEGTIIVLAYEKRDKVTKGMQEKNVVGSVRALYGDPFNIITENKKPFAENIASIICKGFVERGFECVPKVSESIYPEEEVEVLTNQLKPVRVVQFNINKWETDTYLKTKLQYDFDVKIKNKNSEVMTSLKANGEEELEKISRTNPAKNASIIVPRRLKEILENIFNQKGTTEALSIIRPIDELGANY